MAEQLSGPCCVLGAAMNFNGDRDREADPEGALFQALVAAVGAVGFVMLFLL